MDDPPAGRADQGSSREAQGRGSPDALSASRASARSRGSPSLASEQDRHLVAIEHAPPRLLEQPLGQAAVGAEPDQVDPVAVADGVPRRAAGQGVDDIRRSPPCRRARTGRRDTSAGSAGTRPRSGRPSPARGRAAPTSVDGSASPAPRWAISSGRSRRARTPRTTTSSSRHDRRRAGQIDARSSRFHDRRNDSGRPSSKRGQGRGRRQGEERGVADRRQRQVQPDEDVGQLVAVDPPRRDDRQGDQRQQDPLEDVGLRLAERGRLVFVDQAGHAARDQQIRRRGR